MKKPCDMNDEELNEALAVEVEGWQPQLVEGHNRALSFFVAIDKYPHKSRAEIPRYTARFELAARLMERLHPEFGFCIERGPGKDSIWYVQSVRAGARGAEFLSASLPRAVCEAVLDAKRRGA